MFIKKLFLFFLLVLTIRVGAQDIINLCLGETHNFSVPYNSGSVYNWKFQDSSYATIISGNGSENIVLNLDSVGVFKLFVEEYHINGCIGYDSLLIEIHDLPKPLLLANGPVDICQGDNVILYIENFEFYDSYVWSDSSLEYDLLVDDPGQYFVVVSNVYGCQDTSNIIDVYVEGPSTVDFSVEGLCVDNQTIFKSTSSSSGSISLLRWNVDDNILLYGDSISYIYDFTGDYEVELLLETETGCQESVIKDITIFDNPLADFRYSPLIISTSNSEVNFINRSENSSSYLWVFDDTIYSFIENPSYTYNEPGLHQIELIVQDINECQDSISKNLIVHYDFIIYVPNTFTPNEDGTNDIFKPEGLRMDKYLNYQFSIFNKWGDKVFETDDINNGWDGDKNLSGIYNWVLVITDELGEVRKEIGSVNLIR